MTKAEIEALPAGREMDAAIHQHVFGYQSLPFVDPPYSTDISAAWQVFVHGLTTYGNASIAADMEDYGRGAFFGPGPAEVVYVTIGDWQVCAPVCVAICRAALLAASGEQGADISGDNQQPRLPGNTDYFRVLVQINARCLKFPSGGFILTNLRARLNCHTQDFARYWLALIPKLWIACEGGVVDDPGNFGQ